jgi:hypothetical protein
LNKHSIFMRFNKAIPFALLAALYSCNEGTQKHENNTQRYDTVVQQVHRDSIGAAADNNLPDSADNGDYQVYYLTVADTGRDYFQLRKEMFAISEKLKYPIDTQRRYYNRKKDEIVLPDDYDDEMYRGEYYPRRDASNNLSLEYYRVYSNASTYKNIALVAGIYDSRKSADSFLTLVQPLTGKPFVVKANVYVGCMH